MLDDKNQSKVDIYVTLHASQPEVTNLKQCKSDYLVVYSFSLPTVSATVAAKCFGDMEWPLKGHLSGQGSCSSSAFLKLLYSIFSVVFRFLYNLRIWCWIPLRLADLVTFVIAGDIILMHQQRVTFQWVLNTTRFFSHVVKHAFQIDRRDSWLASVLVYCPIFLNSLPLKLSRCILKDPFSLLCDKPSFEDKTTTRNLH